MALDQSRQASSCSCRCGGADPSWVRQDNQLLHALIIGQEELSPSFVRITFGGDDLAALIRQPAARLPAAWVKLYLPATNGFEATRAYTLRKVDHVQACVSIDFFIHDGGIASRWAQAAKAGDVIPFSVPRHGNFVLNPETRWLTLIGDETAFPAIQTIFASVPRDLPGIVLVEAERVREYEQFSAGPKMTMRWAIRRHGSASPGTALIEAIEEMQVPPGRGQAWIAGESGSIPALRTLLRAKWNVEDKDISAKGYWKLGMAGFRT